AVAGREKEGNAPLQKRIADGIRRRLAEGDVEYADVRPPFDEPIERSLCRGERSNVRGTELSQHILGIESNDRLVLDQQRMHAGVGATCERQARLAGRGGRGALRAVEPQTAEREDAHSSQKGLGQFASQLAYAFGQALRFRWRRNKPR